MWYTSPVPSPSNPGLYLAAVERKRGGRPGTTYHQGRIDPKREEGMQLTYSQCKRQNSKLATGYTIFTSTVTIVSTTV